MPVTIEDDRFEVISMLIAERDRLQTQADAIIAKVSRMNSIVRTQLADTASIKGVSMDTHNLDLAKRQFVEKS